MRRTIGLCFLTATLLASAANAQSIFIDKGDPNTVSATVGGGLVKDAWGVGVQGGYSYRGVFDLVLDFTRYAYTGGLDKNLAGYRIMPMLNWHVIRSDVDEMPVSIAFTFGMHRTLFMGSDPVANPEAWGTLLGASVYRRMEIGTSFVFIPEILVAHEYTYTRRFSEALDQGGANVRDDDGNGYGTEGKHGFRALLRPNVLLKAGDTNYILSPYVGWQGALAAGANVGAMF